MELAIFTSTVADGSMKSLGPSQDTEIAQNRRNFLARCGISPDTTTLVHLAYEGDTYCRYQTITRHHRGDGITRPASLVVDALVTTKPDTALFLPLADCIGTVLYDPTCGVLMLSHLGRHNLEQYGGAKSVEYLISHHGVDPANLQVWLSPAAGQANYPLFAFDHRSLHDVAVEQLAAAGVPKQHIDVSPIDTTTDPNYFSHSQFVAGNRPADGRFAVVAILRS